MNYGRYEIIKEVGKGSMGVVYQARDPQIDRLVAIKVLRKDRVNDDTILKMFLKEARIVGKLAHPNIVAIFDVGEERGDVYIAMEFLEGMALSDVIKQQRLNQQEIIAVGTQIAETLNYAHQKGVVHRDIKPSNIIVLNDGQVKVTDFGIAHVEDVTGTLQTQAGEIKGTPAYMSPEQVRGKPVDGRSDIFSLGIILYEMSTGKRPFGGDGKDWITVFDEIVKQTPDDPGKAENTNIGKDLSSVILKSLQKEPAKRYQTGHELFNALNSCRIQEIAPPSSKDNSKIMIFGGVALVVLLVSLASFFMFRGGKVTELKQQVVQSTPAPLPSPTPMPNPTSGSPAPAPGSTTAPVTPQVAPLPVVLPSPSIPLPAAEKKEPAREKKTEPEKRPRISTRANEKQLPKPKPQPRPPDVSSEALKPPISDQPSNSTEYAFLIVSSNPSGAQVYINGALKGMTPRKIKLNLGKYRVRLSRAGYKSVDTNITLDKMAEFSVSEDLKPE
ncbi:MAG: protein kinase domain-containing protein [Desulfuromonadaceae bacterium]